MRVRDLRRDEVLVIGRSGHVAHVRHRCRLAGNLRDPAVIPAALARQDLPVCSACAEETRATMQTHERLASMDPEKAGLGAPLLPFDAR